MQLCLKHVEYSFFASVDPLKGDNNKLYNVSSTQYYISTGKPFHKMYRLHKV